MQRQATLGLEVALPEAVQRTMRKRAALDQEAEHLEEGVLLVAVWQSCLPTFSAESVVPSLARSEGDDSST